jgi:hypothetical protein
MIRRAYRSFSVTVHINCLLGRYCAVLWYYIVHDGKKYLQKHSSRCDPKAFSNRPSIHSPFHFIQPSREPKKRMNYLPFRPAASSRVPTYKVKVQAPVIPPADETINTELTDCLQTITSRHTIALPPGLEVHSSSPLEYLSPLLQTLGLCCAMLSSQENASCASWSA